MDVRALITIAALVSACGAKQPIETETPAEQPNAGESVDTTDYPQVEIPLETFTLDNGLTVVVHEDRKTPVVAVNVWYHVGSKDEVPGKTGFAHLFEHLMFQGSENFKGEFFEPLEKAGATDFNGTTNSDRTNYFETVPTAALDMALWMESDRMGHFAGAISQELLDEQRGVVQNEKRQGQNRPYGKVWEIIPQNTYPAGHPYSWSVIGSMEDLEAATLDDVKKWFAEYYAPSNAVLVLAGDISVEQARAKAEHYFGDIPSAASTLKRGPWVAKMSERREVTAFDRVPQERVYMIWNVPEYGTRTLEELRVAAQVLGTGKNSRLHKRLVYEDELATSASVWVLSREIGSQIIVVADARPGVPLAKVESAAQEELTRFIADGPELEELQRVKMKYFADKVAGLEKVGGFGGKTDLLAQHAVYLGDPGSFERLFGYVREASPAHVQQAARDWLDDGVFVLRVLPEPTRAVAATGADRSKVPDPGQPSNLNLPPIQRAKLANGVEVILAERHETPIVRVRAVFDVGYANDKDGKLGTAQLAMDVLDEGTASMGSLELAATLERLGAQVFTGAGLDYSWASLTTLKPTLGGSLDVLADVIQNPAFDDAEIERIRKRTLASIAQEKAQPFSTALRLLGPLLYGDAHPYGQPLTGSGTEAAVTDLTRDDLVAFQRSALHPQRAKLLVVGDTTMDEILPMLESRFGGWTSDVAAAEPAGASAPRADAVRVFLIDKPDAEQSLIIAGHVIGPRDNDMYLALDVMNAILGGTFMSRINMNLREDKHWSYGARSFVYETKLDQTFATYAQVQTDKTSESMVEIQKELTAIIGGAPTTPDELSRTKDNQTRRLPGQNETTDRVLSSVFAIVEWGLPDDYWNTYVDRVNALTLDDISKAATTYVMPDRLTWIVIGDLDKIEAKVRALGFGEVTILDTDGQPVK